MWVVGGRRGNKVRRTARLWENWRERRYKRLLMWAFRYGDRLGKNTHIAFAYGMFALKKMEGPRSMGEDENKINFGDFYGGFGERNGPQRSCIKEYSRK